MPKKRRNVGANPDINKIGRFDTETGNVDWNIFFANPGFSEVTNQILELLDDKTIERIRDVSPIWKEYIDLHGQNILRWKKWKKLFSLPKAKECFEELPEWKKVMPYIKTKMSCWDLDLLIVRFKYPAGNSPFLCPLQWAIINRCALDVKLVEIMKRSPFDFNTLKYITKTT